MEKALESHLNFEIIICPLIPYMETGICSKTVHKKISQCKYSILEHITNFLFNQQSLANDINPYYSSYSIDILPQSSNFEVQTQVQVNFQTCYEEKYDKDAWPICFMKNDKNILLNIISPYTMCEYLLSNNSNNYCFIPVSFCPPYSNDKKESGHYTCLIIDNFESNVYFFDPNGWTSYFNNNPYETQKYLRLVEKLFEKYLEDLSDFTGTKYNFVSTFQWNPRNLYLNKKFIGSQVDNGGNCVGFAILFAHYVYLTKLPLRTCLENLANLEDGQKIQLINDYSVGLTRFIDPLLEIYKNELYQKMLNEFKSTHPEFSSDIYENLFHKQIMEKINKIFDFDEPNKPNKPDEPNEPNKPNKPNKPNENMSIDDYDPEKFELIYNKNKQSNISNGINTDIIDSSNEKKILIIKQNPQIQTPKYITQMD